MKQRINRIYASTNTANFHVLIVSLCLPFSNLVSSVHTAPSPFFAFPTLFLLTLYSFCHPSIILVSSSMSLLFPYLIFLLASSCVLVFLPPYLSSCFPCFVLIVILPSIFLPLFLFLLLYSPCVLILHFYLIFLLPYISTCFPYLVSLCFVFVLSSCLCVGCLRCFFTPTLLSNSSICDTDDDILCYKFLLHFPATASSSGGLGTINSFSNLSFFLGHVTAQKGYI